MVANLQAVATAGPELKDLQRIFDAQRAAFAAMLDGMRWFLQSEAEGQYLFLAVREGFEPGGE